MINATNTRSSLVCRSLPFKIFSTSAVETGHAKIEIFATDSMADAIIAAIMDAASTGLTGNGIVAVQPFEKIFRVRTRSEVASDNSYI